MPPKRQLIVLAKCLLFALVCWGLYHACHDALVELRAMGFRWRNLSAGWLAVAALFYAIAQVSLGLFWLRLLRSMRQSPHVYPTLRAFFIGHLGKYIPGKLFVVVIRTTLVQNEAVAVVPAALSIFIETLLYMAVGTCLACTALIASGIGSWPIQLAAMTVAVAVLLVTWPPLLVRLVRRAQAARGRTGEAATLPRIELKSWISGWCYCIAAWILNALSLWATMRAMPIADPPELSVPMITRLLAAVATAVVAGFVSFLPGGGIGVREWVLDQLLASEFGATVAILTALLLRAVWLMTEIVGSVILYLIKPKPSATPDA